MLTLTRRMRDICLGDRQFFYHIIPFSKLHLLHTTATDTNLLRNNGNDGEGQKNCNLKVLFISTILKSYAM